MNDQEKVEKIKDLKAKRRAILFGEYLEVGKISQKHPEIKTVTDLLKHFEDKMKALYNEYTALEEG